MSSPSMSDAADTPMSGSCGSPCPQSPISTSKQILDFSKKDCSDSMDSPRRIQSPKTIIGETSIDAERSINSSPATLVPTPRSTPPVNGILTPPNDIENNVEPGKLSKPGGRLKFFKDGVLCLELTHHGEGERTKWVQIRSKTVFPTLVHAKKEAIIPCHSTPSSFASPSSLTHNHRVESSTSHSLSDDACSMLSSPRVRESNRKQPVPQRGISGCLQLYMKPAPCALKLRGKLKELFSSSQDQNRKRWPYNFRRTDIFLQLKTSVQCSCDDEKSHVLTDNSINSAVNNNNNDEDKKKSESPDIKIEGNIDDDDKDKKEDENDEALHLSSANPPIKTEKCETSKPKIVNSFRSRMPLQKVVEHLEKLAETQRKAFKDLTKSAKSNGDVLNETGRKCSGSVKTSSVTPKKRLFNEVDGRESSSVRPKKKSPNRSHHHLNDLGPGRTILNVPGLNSEYYKRQTPTKVSKTLQGHASPLLSSAADLADLSKYSKGEMKRSNRSPNFGAKLASPPGMNINSNSVLKSELVGDRYSSSPSSSSSGRNTSSPRSLSSLTSNLQEQKYFQQQTMSKAISYTITSLLGANSIGNNESSILSSTSSPNSKRQTEYGSHKHSGDSKSNTHSSSSMYRSQRERESKHGSPIRNSSGAPRPDNQDQNSFLRHLLDTSDPIPQLNKSLDRSNKNNLSRSAPTSQNQHYNSSANPSASVATNHNSGRNSGSSGVHSSLQKSSKSSSSNHHHQNNHNALNNSVSKSASSGTLKSGVPSSLSQSSGKDALSDAQQNIAANIALQSLMSSLPFGVSSPYELLARQAAAAANPHSTEALTAAAAAAAALQYGSLIPGNPFNTANNPMAAAAMAASYFGMMPPIPNFPIPTSSSASSMKPSSSPSSSPAGYQSSPSPSSHSKSSTNSSSSGMRKRQHELLQSNHQHSRGNSSSSISGGGGSMPWQGQGLVNGGPYSHPLRNSSSPSFRKAAGTPNSNSHSTSPSIVRSSPSSAISSEDVPSFGGALNLCSKKKSFKVETSPSSVDLDAPLDLCKKSSR